MVDLSEVGAFPSFQSNGVAQIHFGLYLPGVHPPVAPSLEGFSVRVRIIHASDRFNPSVATLDADLLWVAGSTLDLWQIDVSIPADAKSHAGSEGEYLYRYQLWWTDAQGTRTLVTDWFPDPFARSTDIGLMSSAVLSKSARAFVWTDGNYTTPALADLVVYELQILSSIRHSTV